MFIEHQIMLERLCRTEDWSNGLIKYNIYIYIRIENGYIENCALKSLSLKV